MSVAWIFVSFFMSLITNLTVFSGVLALLYWIRGTNNPRIGAHRLGWQLLISISFDGYLFLESLTNTYLGPNAFGLHWTYLNLIVLYGFLFNVILQSRIQLGFTMFTSTLFLLGSGSDLSLTLFVAAMVVNGFLYSFYRLANWYTARWWRTTAGLILFASSVWSGIYLMTRPQLDLWFWVRQVSAFVILSVIICRYAVALRRQNSQMALDHRNATVDPLTEVNNMGACTNALQNAFTDFKSTGQMYALIELDVDWFKRINDDHGHLVGNKVLQRVAAQLKSAASNNDPPGKVYRMGGEEFSILFPITDKRAAVQFANEVQEIIEHLQFQADGEQFGVTISQGIAFFAETDTQVLNIYSRADRNLYAVKRNGRATINWRQVEA